MFNLTITGFSLRYVLMLGTYYYNYTFIKRFYFANECLRVKLNIVSVFSGCATFRRNKSIEHAPVTKLIDICCTVREWIIFFLFQQGFYLEDIFKYLKQNDTVLVEHMPMIMKDQK